MYLLPVLPGFKPEELAAQIGYLNKRFAAFDIACDIDFFASRTSTRLAVALACFRIVRPTPPSIFTLNLSFHRAIHVKHLTCPVDDLQELLFISVVHYYGVARLGLDKHLPSRTVVRRMAVILAVLSAVGRV